ncbi:cold-shock protein [Hirschia baltica]|uniref:Cold-shock DNA-binding domain protein n=1 Tax=Hirschia baltica (strain ATCC 49814 / DSM 5838 / IFAM 1418) TaxID=582402 RepID=C6XI23_HIRBI|nr:cold shock domain-containing protein [Hirschia baltica]ACT58849.1 cold-shock DNA-binding domain protein [Hirschia baltica ATCC 49814]
MIHGTVKYYNSEQGFGLITRADNEKDVRFTFSALKKLGITGIKERQKVKFETETNPDTGKVIAVTLELV